MQHYWFGDLENGECNFVGGDNMTLATRFSEIKTDLATYRPVSVEEACACGAFPDRTIYLESLRELCSYLAEQKIKEAYEEGDAELLQMVRMLDEMDTVINSLTERATEWYIVKNPRFSRKYRSLNAMKMISIMKRERGTTLSHLAGEIERLSSSRKGLMQEISHRADEVSPNCSALVGGLVAARLLSRAGGLEQMSRMPASTIQVLGAANALFTHLRAGAPSPKHGIIFQHRRVHNAPKERRGRVARVLAGKLAIAARLDYYRGVLAPEFIEKSQIKIDAAGEESA